MGSSPSSSSWIELQPLETRDSEVQSPPACCICVRPGGDLIQPCLCEHNRVHRFCFHKKRVEADGDVSTQCPVCHFEYTMERIPDSESSAAVGCFQSYSSRYALYMLGETVAVFSLVFGSFFLFYFLFRFSVFPLEPYETSLWWALGCWAVMINTTGLLWAVSTGRGCDGDHSSSSSSSGNCIFCYCPNHSGNGNDSGALVFIVLAICVFTALLVGFYFCCEWLDEASRRHWKILARYQEMDSWRISDRSIKAQLPA